MLALEDLRVPLYLLIAMYLGCDLGTKYDTFTVENRKIMTANRLKYFGVTLDARLSYKEHLLRANLKASKMVRRSLA